MKKLIVLMVVMGSFLTSSVHADQGPVRKLYRGVANIITAPIEVPKQARVYWIKGAQITPHIIAWIGCGAVWGVVQGVKRAGSGLWDIVSFPIEKPAQFQPLFKPDYVFNDWPRNPKSGR